MEPEGYLSCSQELVTGVYPQPVNPVHILPPSYFSKLILILLSNICLRGHAVA
jgi:hypothetical protein